MLKPTPRNLVTAVIVEGALEHARQDREEEQKWLVFGSCSFFCIWGLNRVLGPFRAMDFRVRGDLGFKGGLKSTCVLG